MVQDWAGLSAENQALQRQCEQQKAVCHENKELKWLSKFVFRQCGFHVIVSLQLHVDQEGDSCQCGHNFLCHRDHVADTGACMQKCHVDEDFACFHWEELVEAKLHALFKDGKKIFKVSQAERVWVESEVMTDGGRAVLRFPLFLIVWVRSKSELGSLQLPLQKALSNPCGGCFSMMKRPRSLGTTSAPNVSLNLWMHLQTLCSHFHVDMCLFLR